MRWISDEQKEQEGFMNWMRNTFELAGTDTHSSFHISSSAFSLQLTVAACIFALPTLVLPGLSPTRACASDLSCCNHVNRFCFITQSTIRNDDGLGARIALLGIVRLGLSGEKKRTRQACRGASKPTRGGFEAMASTRFLRPYGQLGLRGGSTVASSEESDSFNDMVSIHSSDELVQAGRVAEEGGRRAGGEHSEYTPTHAVFSSSDDDSEDMKEIVQQILDDDETAAKRAHFGWDGRLVPHEQYLLVPDDSFPMNSRSGLNVTSLPDARGLPEAVQVMHACETILIRGGYYKWQIGGMPSYEQIAFHEADDFFDKRELKGDPILVAYPLNFAGETARETPLAATTYHAACSPNITVRLHGQWLLTALPKIGMGALWKPPEKQGSFDNLFFIHRTSITPSAMIEARGGRWAFRKCQLRAADGGVPLALYHRARVSAQYCGIGGIALWQFEANAGAILYEFSKLRLLHCTIEWVRFAGEGVRVSDEASFSANKCCFQFNGVDVGFNLAARVVLSNCSFLGSESGALWAMGDVGAATLNVRTCHFSGQVWRKDSGVDGRSPLEPFRPTERPGKMEWSGVSEVAGVCRPRTWRPLEKRGPSFWDSSGESWSITDSISDDQKLGLLNDPYPHYDLDQVVNAEHQDQSYAHLACIFGERDVAAATVSGDVAAASVSAASVSAASVATTVSDRFRPPR